MKEMISIILAAFFMVIISSIGNAAGAEQSSEAGNFNLSATSLSSSAPKFKDVLGGSREAAAVIADKESGQRFAVGTPKKAIQVWIDGLDLPEAASTAASRRTFDFETKTVT